MRVVMGLDVSTKTVGITVSTVSDELELKVLEVEYISLNSHLKKKDPMLLYDKARIFEKHLIDRYVKYHVTDVVIEKPIYCDKDSEKSIRLIFFTGICSDIVVRVFGVAPVFITAYEARKYGLPSLMALSKYDRDGNVRSLENFKHMLKNSHLVLFGEYPFDCSKKFIIWNCVNDKFKGIRWRYSKKDELLNENFDATDSLMCVVGYVNRMKYNEAGEPLVADYDINEAEGALRYTVDFCGEKTEHTIQFGKQPLN